MTPPLCVQCYRRSAASRENSRANTSDPPRRAGTGRHSSKRLEERLLLSTTRGREGEFLITKLRFAVAPDFPRPSAAPRILPLGKLQTTFAFALAFSYLCPPKRVKTSK